MSKKLEGLLVRTLYTAESNLTWKRYSSVLKYMYWNVWVAHSIILAWFLTTKYVHIKSTTVYAPRRNWDSPQPPTRRLVCPLPPVSGGRGILAGEKGVGRVPVPTRGIHCGTLYMYVLCVLNYKYFLFWGGGHNSQRSKIRRLAYRFSKDFSILG